MILMENGNAEVLLFVSCVLQMSRVIFAEYPLNLSDPRVNGTHHPRAVPIRWLNSGLGYPTSVKTLGSKGILSLNKKENMKR